MRWLSAMIVSVALLFGGEPPARAADADPFHFENDIAPLLSRYGCNSSGCHGKAEGQGGFKLSVFGFDPVQDHAGISKEGRGRRIMATAPDESLFLRKATGRTPHGGGTRIKADNPDYKTLRDWIAAGVPMGDPHAPRVESIRVEPAEKVLGQFATQPLRVFAKFGDGREIDVTRHARFQSNNETVAVVDGDGLVRTLDVPGEAAVMASYLGNVAVCRGVVPRPGPKVRNAQPRLNVLDECVDRKLAKLNIEPSPVCDDSEFIRRIHLDLTGSLPPAGTVRNFLASSAPDKRSRLIDELLDRPEYADLMALRWADLLRVNRLALGHPQARAYYRWIRDSFHANKPFDRFARDLVTAEGPLNEVPPANFFKAVPKPGEAASTLSQVFLGVRIACAECHHHPTDRWSQTDYFGMVAFFAPVGVKGAKEAEAVVAAGDPATKHPRSGLPVPAHPLGEKPPQSDPAGDRRLVLAEWMTRPGNPYFARNFANRLWAHLLGRGIVEPVDDVRATNPPANPELLDALAAYAVETKYDTKAVVRLICNSRVYQSSSAPTASNGKDERNFSRATFRRPGAEVLHDMIAAATGIPERFAGMPPNTRAVQVWDSEAKHEFLKLFGRPSRVTACECERNAEPSTAQVLNLLNSPELQRKLSHDAGTVAGWVESIPDDGNLAEEMYLSLYARFPGGKERGRAVAYLKSKPDRRKAAEDLAWAMLNSLEFQFNH
jgi:hypothetical protein